MPRAYAPGGVSQGELEARITALKTEMEGASKSEREELHNRIKSLEDRLEEEKAAKEAKEKNEGTGGTLVLPPDQAPQAQHHGDNPGDQAVTHSDTRPDTPRKGRWKGIW